ncbi:uncharacterized protein [Leptinotarsa decemlineata]|uniref:uncharacterized protein n=1 Tax=Leptinotarsa decemlineata TaxID=7539 RepID=UPI000C25424B|nr:cuticle protein 65-like [Leptinotarsa decemlineata]
MDNYHSSNSVEATNYPIKMFKLIVVVALVSAARAGVISGGYGGYGGHGGYGLGDGLGIGHGVVAVAAPAVAVAHGASSYQNSNLLALNPTAVVSKVAVAAPIVTKVAAPIAYGVAPVGLGLGFGKGVSYGYH